MISKRIEIYMSIKNFSQINRKKGKKENKAKQDRKRERETVRDSARMNTQVPCPLAAEANSSSPSSLAPLPLELLLLLASYQLLSKNRFTNVKSKTQTLKKHDDSFIILQIKSGGREVREWREVVLRQAEQYNIQGRKMAA